METETKLLLWNPKGRFGTRTFSVETKISVLTQTFIVEPESSLRNPNFHYRVHKVLPLVQCPETGDYSTHRPVLFV